MSFLIDSIFVNFLKSLLIQVLILTKKNVTLIEEFTENFKDMFGSVTLTKLKDYHIRYIATNRVFTFFVLTVLIMCVGGIIYDFLCTLLWNSSTIGQKIMSLKVVNRRNNERPNALKLLLRALLVPLPLITIFLMIIFQFLSFINFHNYAPRSTLLLRIMISLTVLTNPYLLATILAFFAVFWYNSYYLTDRLIFSDILSGTRVISTKFHSLAENNEEEKDMVYFGDKLLTALERLNRYLFGILKNWCGFLREKFLGLRRKSVNDDGEGDGKTE